MFADGLLEVSGEVCGFVSVRDQIPVRLRSDVSGPEGFQDSLRNRSIE
jgi:hypothetical protein